MVPTSISMPMITLIFLTVQIRANVETQDYNLYDKHHIVTSKKVLCDKKIVAETKDAFF